MNREKIKQRIKFWAVILVISIVISFAVFTVLKYEVEGEKNIPFELGKIIVISSATTTDVDNGQINENKSEDEQKSLESNESRENNQENAQEEKFLWKEKVIQTNDVYIYLDKNSNYKEQQKIKTVKIENIKILQNVKIGKIQVYMPNSIDDSLYKYTNDFLVNTSLTYTGASADNKKTLEIGNQGGCICISFANTGIGEYKSNEDQQIEQGASILEKMNVKNEDLKFKVSFDLIIEVQDKSYKTNIVLDLPIDEVVGKKETHKEFTDFDKIVLVS